jgi:hypothetical protein
MLVTVKRNEDGTVDGFHLYPETVAETRELTMLANERVNVKSGTLFLLKEGELKKRRVEMVSKHQSPDANEEVYRHT